jgi:hypothetical protein
MRFSGFKVAGRCRDKKKPPSLAVFRSFAGSGSCACVNLPLLRRLWAGIAKVKMAGKKHHTVHGGIRNRLNDYSNNRRRLASALSADCAPPRLPAGCDNPTLAPSIGRRLIHISRRGASNERL